MKNEVRTFDNKPTWLKIACILFAFCAAMAIPSPAQILTTLHSFDITDGAEPYFAALVQATDGNFYGTTAGGGAHGNGTVFKITHSGTLTTLHSFDYTDGASPYAGLVQATDGNFYGTTFGGGANPCVGQGCGTVFKITPGGTLTTLYSFGSQPYDGFTPVARLVQATDGNFYGTTVSGGAYSGGTVFKITPSGTLTTLYSFDGPDGDSPYAGLVQAADGNFYGTTEDGGANNTGTVFKITPSGTLTTLYSFCPQGNCADGSIPAAGLVQATDGNFYGTTYEGGANNTGTVFKITPSGALTTLHSFDGADGAMPTAGLVQATDGNLYGTTFGGGANGSGSGTVFKITPSGTLTTLYSFGFRPNDGLGPTAGLVQATDGNFYGTTFGGGANGYGTVFRLVTLRGCLICRAAAE